MTLRMALTQSSISLWELAISWNDSWLIPVRSLSPAPPGKTTIDSRSKKEHLLLSFIMRYNQYFISNTDVKYKDSCDVVTYPHTA